MDKYIKYQVNGKTHEIILTDVELTVHIAQAGEYGRGYSGNPSYFRNIYDSDWSRPTSNTSIRHFIPLAHVIKIKDVKPVDNEGLPTEWEFV